MGSKRRVAQIGPCGQGGVNTMIETIMNADFCEDYCFTRIITSGSGNGISAYCKALLEIKKIKKEVDIAHIHMASRGSFVRKSIIIMYLSRKRIPIVLHLHGAKFREYYQESPRVWRHFIKRIFNLCDSIIMLTDDWIPFAQTLCIEKKTKIIPNFTTIPQGNYHKEEDGVFNILFLGRLGKRKGTYDLILAIEKLIKEKGITGLNVVLAGDGDVEAIQQLICSKGLSEIIHITGWIDGSKKNQLLAECNMVVLPSYFESFGLSLIEGMSYEKPVIGTNAGSIPNVVNDKEDGFLTNAGDIGDLSEKIYLLYSNKELREKMGRNARNHVIKKYSEVSFRSELESVYNNILNRA